MLEDDERKEIVNVKCDLDDRSNKIKMIIFCGLYGTQKTSRKVIFYFVVTSSS